MDLLAIRPRYKRSYMPKLPLKLVMFSWNPWLVSSSTNHRCHLHQDKANPNKEPPGSQTRGSTTNTIFLSISLCKSLVFLAHHWVRAMNQRTRLSNKALPGHYDATPVVVVIMETTAPLRMPDQPPIATMEDFSCFSKECIDQGICRGRSLRRLNQSCMISATKSIL